MTTPETLEDRLARCLKPLAWHNFDVWTWWAESPSGTYHVEERNGYWQVELRVGGLVHHVFSTDDTTPEDMDAAQAAAQADYTARILAALDLDALAREVEAMVGAETERCARLVDCGCDPAKKAIAANGGNSGDRWRACQEANCGAQDAAAIRAREGGKP